MKYFLIAQFIFLFIMTLLILPYKVNAQSAPVLPLEIRSAYSFYSAGKDCNIEVYKNLAYRTMRCLREDEDLLEANYTPYSGECGEEDVVDTISTYQILRMGNQCYAKLTDREYTNPAFEVIE